MDMNLPSQWDHQQLMLWFNKSSLNGYTAVRKYLQSHSIDGSGFMRLNMETIDHEVGPTDLHQRQCVIVEVDKLIALEAIANLELCASLLASDVEDAITEHPTYHTRGASW